MYGVSRLLRLLGAVATGLGILSLLSACESPLLEEIRQASTTSAVLTPEIHLSVKITGDSVLGNGDTHLLPSKYIGAPESPVLFKIHNLGEGELLLTGSEKVQRGGADKDAFAIAQPPGRISAGTYEEFSIDFTPLRLGQHTASITIESNDPRTPVFSVTITAEATATPVPAIQLMQGSTWIPQEMADYSFGEVIADGTGNITSGEVVFTILNNGSGDLTISNILFSSGDTADFKLFDTADNHIPAGDTTDFGISFDPVSTGEKSVELRILHNDEQNNPTVFTLSGTGVAPRMRVGEDSGEIVHNGTIDLGTPFTGQVAESTLTIFNDGSSDLHLTNLPLEVSGTDQSYFTVLNQPSGTIAPGGNSSITVQFTNRYEDQSGPRTANLQIGHDDTSGPNSPFRINLTAQAVEWSGIRQIDSIGGGRNQILYHPSTHPKVFSVHASWIGSATGIRFGRSDDGGATWTNNTIDGNGSSPKAHMSGIRIAIVYKSGDNLVFTTSVDYGQTWSSKQVIASNLDFYDIAGSDHSTRDILYISYRDTTTGNLLFRKSEDGGTSWEPAKTVVASTNDVGWYNSITCERLGTYVFVSYFNNSSKSLEVVGSGDGGDTWTPPRTVDSSVASLSATDIAVHASQLGPIVVAYTDTSNNLGFARCGTFHSFFYDFDNSSWSTSVIDSNVNLSTDLSIAYNSGRNDVYIAYRDMDQKYMYLMKSEDGGHSWLPRKGVDTFGDAGRFPSIAVHSNAFNELVLIGNTNTTSSDYRLAKSKTGGDDW